MGIPSVEPDWYDQQNILVEHVRNGVRVSAVILTSMVEQQVLEEFKLSDRVV